MYERYFNLKCKPFDLVPNPDFLFLSSTHKKAITYLDYGVKERIGFILLTGEIGSGKTTVIRNLIKTLNGSVRLSRINNTKVSSEHLISMINEDFGLNVDGKNKTKLLSELNEFLIDQYAKKSHPILLIDEAQNLSPDLLEEIRLLSNLETDRSKLLQIILVGQPELKRTLMIPEMLQLRQRININYHIAPLSLRETGEYIKYRIEKAGNPDVIDLTGDISNIVYKFSRGIPRLINILCDFALLAAYVDGQKIVTAQIVKQVSEDLESRDYWSESQGTARVSRGDEQSKSRKEADLAEVTGRIALKIIELETMIKDSVNALSSLSEKVDRLSKDLSLLKDREDPTHISDRMERLEDKLVCRILLRVAEENNYPDIVKRISELERAKEHKGNSSCINNEEADCALNEKLKNTE